MQKEEIVVRIRRLPGSNDLPLPSRASEGSSGFDLYACVDREVAIPPGKWMLIPTGISLDIPPGYEAQVRPRSGLALNHGITVLNSPGTIDSDYRGEVGVILFNHGSQPFKVCRGDRVAQIVFCKISSPILKEADELGESQRGPGGFGHTGI